MLLQLIASGSVMGFIYALIALGFQITYSTSKTSNFGQGSIVMPGSLSTAWLTPRVGYACALPAVVAICAVVALSFVISAALAELAVWAVSPITGAGPTLEMLGVKGFCAAVVGSMSRARGAQVAGVAMVIAFKPTGLFGKARITKV